MSLRGAIGAIKPVMDNLLREVACVCPACGGQVPTKVYLSEWVRLAEEVEVNVDLLSQKRFDDMASNGYLDRLFTCPQCDAFMAINTITRTVSIEPETTALEWIDSCTVPITAALPGVWPSHWLFLDDGYLDADIQLVLEVLFQTKDIRLPSLLTRMRTHGFVDWEREGETDWKASVCHPGITIPTNSSWDTEALQPDGAESFEDSIRAVCPSPPSIELVVAAVERARKKTP